jgi:putative ABC transport system ATP-binding protein
VRPAIDAADITAEVTLPSGDRLRILDGLSLSVPEGAAVAVIGRSGSGKTTLLTVLGLMSRRHRGRLTLGGVDTGNLSDADTASLRNSRIGFVFQGFSLIDHLTVLDNVELPFVYGAPTPAPRRRALGLLDQVGLAGFGNRPVNQLSGGEQQRVAIARALVRSPSIILADEPTGALDVQTGGAVMRLLRDATRGAGAALVVVTHDRDVAAIADEQWVLRDGRLHAADAAGGEAGP